MQLLTLNELPEEKCLEVGVICARMKMNATYPMMPTPALTAVLIGEKEINLFCSSPLQQGFKLEAKVKWEKTGKRKIEG